MLQRETGTRHKPLTVKQATLKPGKTAAVETSKGKFEFVLYQKDMPKTTSNFIKLARKGFYTNTIIHRYEPNFVVQGGKPREGVEEAENIKFEHRHGLKFKAGTVGMARVGDDYDSANSQFFICLTEAPHLDGNYAAFGQLTKGMDVVKKLRENDKILKVEIVNTRTGK